MIGVYVHVPFCASRCVYCGFVSTTLGRRWWGRYLSALDDEARRRYIIYGRARARSIYVGGGTPSLPGAAWLEGLVDVVARRIDIADGAEFTVEVNPDDVSPELVRALRSSGLVNRISVGVQSLNDGVLRFLRRRHTAREALRALDLLRGGGFSNLSADVIYGIPGQDFGMFAADVGRLISLGVPHLSAYSLQYEPGTPLWRMRGTGRVAEADEELSLRCYSWLIDACGAAGMEHYELSSFALPGFRAVHNSGYWRGVPYMGLGLGAHSYDGRRVRSVNVGSVAEYVAGRGRVEREVLTDDELYNEMVMLSLRTCEGLSLPALAARFGRGRVEYCLRLAEPHVGAGLLERRGGALRLTRRGLFVSNGIMADLMAV